MTFGRSFSVSFASVLRHGGLASLAWIAVGASSATAAPPSSPSHSPASRSPDDATQRAGSPQGVDSDSSARNVVARARMLECGHQWSTLKKNGTASGTWKEFSRGCLAQR